MIRLIVIDEDELVRIGIRQMLQDSKLQVVAVSDSGARILAGIEQFQPHVILLDMPLENDDSFTALRQAKSKHPEIPVLMLSTFDDPITASRAAGLGASGVLLKPLNRKQIIQEVKGVYKHVLTEEIAEQFVTDDNSVDLSEFTVIEAVAARVLKRHNGPLNLSSLAELPEAAAESLSKHEGEELSLNGLTELSGPLSEILSLHHGTLSLGGLASLTTQASKSLSKHDGTVRLSGLQQVSENVAANLSELRGSLILNGIQDLPDVIAERLSLHRGGDRHFYELLVRETVKVDRYYKVSATSPEEAVEIVSGGHEEGILREWHEDIDYDNVSEPTVYDTSSNNALSLGQVTHLSDTAAGHLAKHPNLTINIDNLPASAAQILRDAGHG